MRARTRWTVSGMSREPVSPWAGEPVGRWMTLLVVLVVLLARVQAAGTESIHHALSVRVSPDEGSIRAVDRLRLRAAETVSFELAKGLAVERFVVNGSEVRVDPGAGRWEVPSAGEEERLLLIEYAGRPDAQASGLIVGSTESVLSGGAWYPRFAEGLLTYRLEVDVPATLTAVAPGRIVAEERSEGRYRAVFESEGPADDLALLVGPFELSETRYGKRLLRTYFHPEVADLSGLYLKKTADYIDLYEDRIGPYPFSGFSVVSTTLPVGLGFPGLTLIGARVLRLPFLPETSLGHEVLHSWWGNGVLVDASAGNWAEGLTTFMADYAYAESDGAEKAHEMRLRWLRDYAVLPAAEDRPLTSFHGRSHAASQVVGYHKAAALFLMLRDWIGSEAFDGGIRRFWKEHRFRPATWVDLRNAFESNAGRALDGFFRQWLERTGAPTLRLRDAALRRAGGAFEVAFTLEQEEPAYDLEVPIDLDVDGERHMRSVRLRAKQQRYVLRTDGRPRELRVDPRHRLFRRLEPAAVPPILRGVAFERSSRAMIVVDAADARAAARQVIDAFFEHPAHLVEGETLPSVPCLVVGTDAAMSRFLARNGLSLPSSVGAQGTARVWAAKRLNGGAFVVVSAGGAEALRAVARPLPHYGSRSFLVFDGSRVVESGVWPVSEESLRARLTAPAGPAD